MSGLHALFLIENVLQTARAAPALLSSPLVPEVGRAQRDSRVHLAGPPAPGQLRSAPVSSLPSFWLFPCGTSLFIPRIPAVLVPRVHWTQILLQGLSGCRPRPSLAAPPLPRCARSLLCLNFILAPPHSLLLFPMASWFSSPFFSF